MSHTVSIELLPAGVTSYDVWEVLTEEGLSPTVLVTANEAARAPQSLHLEFPSSHDAVRAIRLLRERLVRDDFFALAG